MSGGYKYADVGIDPSVGMYDAGLGCIILGSILAQRVAEAAVEAVKRLDAEEAVLSSSLNKSRSGFTPVTETLRLKLADQKANLMPADHINLNRRFGEAEAAVGLARTHVTLQEAVQELSRIEQDIERGKRRKEAEDQRTGKSTGMTALRSRYEILKRSAAGLMEGPGTGPLGPAGAAAVAVKSALAAAGGSLQTTNESMIGSNVDRLESAVMAYEDLIRENLDSRERQNALARQLITESSAIITGLRADPIVMRWHSLTVDELEKDLTTVGTVVQADAQSGVKMVESARVSAATIVKEANAAQVKADQRDYIARSISSTLVDMGFVVSEPIEEHPGHPATSSIVHAATASGKAIAVSVPVDGQVWYNVEGYVKTVDAKVGGGEAAVCDEAEEVIEQMHEALAEEFHVHMGELKWEGKDPKRKLRAAKSSPKGGSSARGLK